ncbi:type II secretion system F family protein [Budvicia aquatica]|uniref:Flp pilus assembly protein TadB n=1 Tax=Budvicia aquatica TaxID=82979 RepID=A0A2C6DNI3_9GAMM|nr:type II secretion system F family protein [Budvicia aquatica]PHI29995.1 hypothetical protein CRN84_11920 [Budvicia aquatica]VFS48873.1 Flp pilus assembly protein TadB [Budvicia aquatica]
MTIIFSTILILGLMFVFYMSIKNKQISRMKEKMTQLSDSDSELISVVVNSADSKAEKVLAAGSSALQLLKLFDEKGLGKVLVSAFLVIILMAADIVFKLEIKNNNMMVLCLFIIIAVIVIPGMIRKVIVGNRISKIEKDMPMFVDLLAICVQSGLTIEVSLKFLSESVGDVNSSFVPFLTRLVKRIDVNGLESGLSQLQHELPSREVSMLCVTLKQSLRYGSSIYEYLMELSTEMRELQLLKTEELIGKISAKMSVPLILFFMFPVVIIIAAPGVMRVMAQG